MAEVATAHIEDLVQDDQLTQMGIMDNFAFSIIMDLVTKSKYEEQRLADQCEAVRAQLYIEEDRNQREGSIKEQYDDYA